MAERGLHSIVLLLVGVLLLLEMLRRWMRRVLLHVKSMMLLIKIRCHKVRDTRGGIVVNA